MGSRHREKTSEDVGEGVEGSALGEPYRHLELKAFNLELIFSPPAASLP